MHTQATNFLKKKQQNLLHCVGVTEAAEELGVNLFYAGHYATETFGVKALGKHAQEKFGLPWEFLDHPTGL